MENINNFLQSINPFHIYITIGLALLVIILLIMLIIVLKSLNSLEKRYRKFMRGVNNKNIEELVIQYLDRIDDVKKQSDYMKEVYNDINNKVDSCIQKVSILRYRAFEDVGSDLSYSIALLNNNNDGVILTSIYGRNESTTYGKPIDKGISRYDLSEEEEQVLKEAISKK